MNLNRPFFSGFAAGVLSVLLLLLVFVAGTHYPAAGPGAAPVAAQKTPPAVEAKPAEAQAEAGEKSFRGVADAPVTIIEYADFHCPFCKKANTAIEKLMADYAGKLKLEFYHYPLSGAPGKGSWPTHEAAACAGKQGKFWEYHDKIFEHPGAPQKETLSAFASELGLDTAAFEKCLANGETRGLITSDRSKGSKDGVSGTPAFFINDFKVEGAYPYDYFKQVVDALLNPAEFKLPAGAAEAEELQNVQFDDLEGRHMQGPKDAPVTIVEFSDFHCPFCTRLSPTLQQLMQTYDGKIRRVFRHFPLSFHAGADKTHEASECAGEQGKFWEFLQKAFETSRSYDRASHLEMAKQIGLDLKAFESCLDSGKFQSLIQADIAKGSASGVSGTPTIFINGQKFSGAQSYDTLKAIVESKLSPSN